MVAIGGAFAAIRMRQHTLDGRESSLDAELVKKKEQIRTVEQIQKQRNAMWTTAVTTVELIEPVPKSVLLALLTNNLPKDVGLLRIGLIQKEQPAAAKLQADKNQTAQAGQKQPGEAVSKERLLETRIEIEGTAPSDIEVASYIEQLSNSPLLKNVALVESAQMQKQGSKQDSAEDKTRRFKLTAVLERDIAITNNDIEQIANSGDLRIVSNN